MKNLQLLLTSALIAVTLPSALGADFDLENPPAPGGNGANAIPNVIECGSQASTISVSDVTWNGANASNCWELDANNSFLNHNTLVSGGTSFSQEYKVEDPPGTANGMTIAAGNEQTWSFDTSDPLGPFMIWLKGSNYMGLWLFDPEGTYTGSDYAGTWQISFPNNGNGNSNGPALSNAGLLSGDTPPNTPPNDVPVPTTIALVLLGLLGVRRHRTKA